MPDQRNRISAITSDINTNTKHNTLTSIVVVLASTNEMCMIRNPRTLNANAKFNTR